MQKLLPCFLALSLAVSACSAPDPGPDSRVPATTEADRPGARPEPRAPSAVTDAVQPTPSAEAAPPAVHDLQPYFQAPPLSEALADFQAGRNAQAADRFEAFVAGSPDDPRARPARFMGLLARHDAGQFLPAAEQLEAMAAEWPLMSDYALFYAGSSYVGAERHADAARVLATIPNDSRLDARASELRARALVSLDKQDEAIAVLRGATQRSPGASIPAYTQLATLLEAKGDAEGARAARREVAVRFATTADGKAARSALGKDAGFSPEQQLAVGKAFYDAQQHQSALTELKAAIERLPDGSYGECEAFILVGRTYEKMKKASEGWPWFERALECKGEPLALATFVGGRNRLRAGQLDKAEELLKKHLELFPERSTVDDVSLMLAEVYRKRGDDAAADKQLVETIRRWPDGDMIDDVSWQLIWPRIEAGQTEQALEMTATVLELRPREVSYRAEGRTRYWRGRLLAKLGRMDEAKGQWRQVISEYPLSWYTLLAHARLAQDSPAEARQAVEAAMRSADLPPDPLARIPAPLWRDEHFRKAVELARMGLGTSARRELQAAPRAGAAAEGARRDWVWTEIALYDLAGAHDLATALSRAEEPRFGAYWPLDHHRRLWELAHPRPYADLVLANADQRNISPWWLWAIMREESGFNPNIESWANAIGLMQIILPTAEFLSKGTGIEPTRENLKKPENAILLGAKYLGNLFRQHPSFPLASAGYNAGGGAVNKWRRSFGDVELDEFVERIPYDEARGYAKRVTRSVARYQWLYGGQRVLELDVGPPGAP